ncbi:uncharacterized protein LOC116347887 isoform X2 [Contarinia nasturtii]|nr:uncharacterized protein LOC116347887 isoform X2 [Contarinia nasturtii]XP_031634541.1 uncharacterized protein LOC116347887 isoform X2 [Contarinia nasturtii]
MEYARGLWGIKHTRRPVDHLVTMAKTSRTASQTLPLCNLTISLDGVFIEATVLPQSNTIKEWNYSIDSISYGVQDLVYTRVFAMIVVKDNFNIQDPNPFEVHAFVCDSRALARRLTYALAASFQDYSKRVKEIEQQITPQQMTTAKKKFAIDLRTPEEMQQDQETEA